MKLVRVQFFLITAILLIGGTSYAQFASDNGLFEVDVIRGCPGTTIQITNLYAATCDCTSLCPCDFDYDGDGEFDDPKAMPFEYTYDTPGVYILEILFSGTSDFITITIEDKPAPEFNVYSCSGQTVVAEINDTSYESYEVDFGDGTVVTIPQGDPVPSHTYADASPKTVTVRGLDPGSSNNCQETSKIVTPLATLPAPSITSLTPADASSLTLGITNEDNILYELRMSENNGAFTLLGTITASTPTEIVDGLDLEANYYCFRLVAVDPCGGPEVPSADVCSILAAPVPEDASVTINWQTGANTGPFDLYRDNILLESLPDGTEEYTDTDVLCGTEYCYEIRTEFSGAVVSSLPVCTGTTGLGGPPPVTNITTVVNPDGTVSLTWYTDNPAAYNKFDVYRQGPENVPRVIAEVNATTFTDSEVEIPGESDYCYEIVPEDLCGNRSPDNVQACVIQLFGATDPTDLVALNWNAYNGYENGLQYYSVEKSTGGSFSEIAQTTDTTYTETDSDLSAQVLMYRITAVASDPTYSSSLSNVIILYKSVNLFFPEAFTPDGDGLNDEFVVKGRFLSSYEIRIFNRWGEMVFRSDDINRSWDGRLDGEDVQEGTFACIIRVTDESGTETEKEASIVLVRR